MREEARKYLLGEISRRQFVGSLTGLGVSAAGAQSVLAALAPLTRAGLQEGGVSTIPYQGLGGELLVRQLEEFGVRFLFVCNSSGMGPLADALVDRPHMHFIQAVSEHQAMAIADGYAKASGETAFACFSRVGGPLASANMYNAMKDRTPVVVFTDHANSRAHGRDGHEDIEDWLEPFKQYTKWRWLATEPSRIPEWLSQAFRVASMAPGGPTLLRVPRDLLYRENVRSEILPRSAVTVPMNVVPETAAVERMARLLLEAKMPLLYLSHEVWTSGARPLVVELAELLAIPVTQARSWAADFPTDHPLFLGQYYYPMRVLPEMDLFVNLGAHMPNPGNSPTEIPRQARLIHVRLDSRYLAGNYPVELPLVADVKETVKALLAALKSLATPERLERIRQQRLPRILTVSEGMRKALQKAARSSWNEAPISWPRLLLTLNRMMDEDGVIVTEVGTEDWVLRAFPFADGKKLRIGRTVGRALGWGVGASIGVKLAIPDRQVVSLQGDGGFLFGQSDALWSMSRYDVPVLTVVANNHSYDEPRNQILGRNGRAAQENKDMICYLGHPNVDFTHIARAYAVEGMKVRTPDELEEGIAKGIETTRQGRPFLLDVEVARTGVGADSTWYPAYSVAARRTRRV